MANELEIIPSPFGVAIPTYIATHADALIPGIPVYVLAFAGGAPPNDGSIGLCFVDLQTQISGLHFANGDVQRLMYFSGGALGGSAAIVARSAPIIGGDGTHTKVWVPGFWKFVADIS